MNTILDEAVNLILEEEGIDQPGRWPGGGSGITLGYGCDIGADPASLEFWRGILPDDAISRLSRAKGITGRAAAQIQTRFSDIHVTHQEALDVFTRQSLPREISLTLKTYPGIELLPPAFLGAMVSVTYNRGSDLDWDRGDGDRREELRQIFLEIKAFASLPVEDQDAERVKLAAANIAHQIRSMKRLWAGKGLDGLIFRREAEAKMIEGAVA